MSSLAPTTMTSTRELALSAILTTSAQDPSGRKVSVKTSWGSVCVMRSPASSQVRTLQVSTDRSLRTGFSESKG